MVVNCQSNVMPILCQFCANFMQMKAAVDDVIGAALLFTLSDSSGAVMQIVVMQIEFMQMRCLICIRWGLVAMVIGIGNQHLVPFLICW